MHLPLPGVTIGDCGKKNGLNGVDNGFIIFKNVRIPRENLLDRFSHVSEEGEF
jgi:acyl-CoA oxidase